LIVWLIRRLGASAPAWTAFLASLVLSSIAIGGSSVLNRDGMLYVDAARGFLADGYPALIGTFDWLLLPMLIAGLGVSPAYRSGPPPPHRWPVARRGLRGDGRSGAPLQRGCRWRGQPAGGCWPCLATTVIGISCCGFNTGFHRVGWLALRWGTHGMPLARRYLSAGSDRAMLFRFEAVAFFLALMAGRPRANRRASTAPGQWRRCR
jgi:hypothetical protein